MTMQYSHAQFVSSFHLPQSRHSVHGFVICNIPDPRWRAVFCNTRQLHSSHPRSSRGSAVHSRHQACSLHRRQYLTMFWEIYEISTGISTAVYHGTIYHYILRLFLIGGIWVYEVFFFCVILHSSSWL